VATYAIGDVQGCWKSLEALLDRCDYDSVRDRLWFTGDLVNRGPASASVLRWVYEHRHHVTVVLGNHDLHLLARVQGHASPKHRDTLDDIVESREFDAPLRWLQQRPLLHRETLTTAVGPQDYILVHAGLLPQWTLAQAESWASLARAKLGGPKGAELLRRLAACRNLSAGRRHRSTRAAAWAAQLLTNLRVCDAGGRPALRFSDAPKDLPAGLHPWHAFQARRQEAVIYVCGHWAAQGLRTEHNLRALDSGCVWGGQLSALRLEDDAVIAVECRDDRS
jgi:bis(5'-nucleosyl)-tetraphosphatase (symmetrical)